MIEFIFTLPVTLTMFFFNLMVWGLGVYFVVDWVKEYLEK
tara:strand:+ start:1019 stop:1138 length:120 start_codon:yes stop_codon:yes gene_type:complete